MNLPASVPELIPVKDSNVLAFGYDPDGGYLYVQFRPQERGKDAPTYRYADVTKGVFERMSKSHSKGMYMWLHIRRKYPYAKWSGSGWRKETALKRESAQRRRRKAKK